MREALTTLPWVEPDTILADRNTRQARFAVKDKAAFNLDEVNKALGSQYNRGVKVLTGPTDE